MTLFAYVLLLAGVGFFVLANYWFVMNTRYENHDQMGASINFDQPFFISALLISVGIGILGLTKWFWCIGIFFGLLAFGMIYKWWVLEKIMAKFRRPNP